jgi:hypothetical protein
MFRYGQQSGALFQVEHQHSDGTWARLEPEPSREPHDAADIDPEKEWGRGHVYVCTSCQARVRVSVQEVEQTTG